MCGIVGIHSFSKNLQSEDQLVDRMCNAIVHRGPDDVGSFTDHSTGLGMRRLSIIDLSTGKQPIFNENNSLVIVFNGEIYNFKEIRHTLESKGHIFKTLSDTEVILHGFEEYGDNVLKHLNGMFAFAIWDKINQQLFIARDRVGIKPLYYYQDDNNLIFASEIKAILASGLVKKEVDHNGIACFLSYGCNPETKTLFKNIQKLAPGHMLRVNQGKVTIKKYWDISFQNHEKQPFDYYCDRFRELLTTSVKRRLISDVPLGAFLSGGLDSSSIVTIMAKLTGSAINTYSIGFGGPDNFHSELSDAKDTAERLHTNHHEILVKPDVVNMLPKLIWHMDEPVADTSIFVTYLVSKLARETVTVILSGVGGDELFGGYRRYLCYTLNKYYRLLPNSFKKGILLQLANRLPVDRGSYIKNLFRLGRAFINSAQLPENEQYHNSILLFNNDLLEALTSNSNIAADNDVFRKYFIDQNCHGFLNNILYFDQKTMLVDDLLLLTDKMSMATSLEARVPFLDHELVEFAATIPEKYKVNNFNLRYIQKEAMKKLLPPEILKRRKRGFGCPIGRWVKEELREYIFDLFSEEKTKKRGYFNYKNVNNMLADHFNESADYTDQIFALLTLEIWHQQFIDG